MTLRNKKEGPILDAPVMYHASSIEVGVGGSVGKHSQMQRLGIMWPGLVWIQPENSDCFLPKTEMPKINL